METFLTKHAGSIHSSLSCFDRLIFTGYLPLGYAEAMDGWLHQRGILLKHFSDFVQKQAERIRTHAQQLTARAGRPLLYLRGRERKESIVDRELRRQPLEKGLICVLTAVE